MVLLLLTKETDSQKNHPNAVNTIIYINYPFRTTFKFLHASSSALMLMYLHGISL